MDSNTYPRLVSPAGRAKAALGVAILLAACGRQETPAYFKDVTGIAICDSAKVRNVRPSEAAEAGLGVLYTVALRMSLECERDFLTQAAALRSKSGVIRPGKGKSDAWITAVHRGGELIVTFTD